MNPVGYLSKSAVIVAAALAASIGGAHAGTIGTCPASVFTSITFPAAGYICAQQDVLWLNFVDYGATTPGMSALPAGSMVHFNLGVGPGMPDRHIVTVEPGAGSEFLAGATYSFGFDVVAMSADIRAINYGSQDITFPGGSTTLTTAMNALTVLSYNADGSPNIAAGGSIGLMTSSTSNDIEFWTGDVDGIRFVDTVTGISPTTVIQSISNDLLQAPEPISLAAFVVGLFGLKLARRFRRR